MTAPLTPPHQPPPDHQPPDEPPPGQPHDPWQAPPPGAAVTPPSHEDPGPGMKVELREAVLIVVAVAAVGGSLLGLLWSWLAPRVPLISDGEAVFLRDNEGEQAIGADGTFILLALVIGLVSAVLVFLLRKRGGVPLAVGLMLGGLLGSVVAWRFGIWLGPGGDVVERAKDAGAGVPFDAPLKLHAKGALLAWPIVSMAALMALMAAFGPRDPEPPGYLPPQPPQEP
ncbi:DUF2567 domain-containing protein [Streptomyces apocyni]|uniref:DUF2567 domain-containing protein n=1 Tax=Streptomyces apocyni TaxID=2654677 RepID=UPI0012E9B311|nr:DUF2567 domain-containing protein [Streptomyces apocyni]